MSEPVCLIVNPAAGGGKAGRLAPAVEQALRGHGLTMRRADTRDLQHARELGRQAANLGETVVALSGDGMLGALADELREIPGSLLGVLPGGRGNDLARVLGIPEDAVEACATIAHGIPRPIDLGLVDAGGSGSAQAYVGIASAGFDSDANRIANEAPAWLGGLVYAYGALARCSAGARRALRSSSTRPGSVTASPATPSAPATRRPTAAACTRRRTPCSTTGCSRS